MALREEGVSIIVPAYNAETTIKACVQSAMRSGSRVNEVIVVDDGSTDRTCDVVGSIEGPIKLIRQKNAGVSAARNLGLSAARSEYVAFLDADDEMVESSLDGMLKMALVSRSDLVYGNYAIRSSAGVADVEEEVFSLEGKRVQNEKLFSSLLSLKHNSASGAVWRVLFRREFLVSFDIQFPVGVRMGEDLIFILSCLSANPIVHHCEGRSYILNRMVESVSLSYVSTMEDDLLCVVEAFRNNPLCGSYCNQFLMGRMGDVAWQSCSTIFKAGTTFNSRQRLNKVKEIISRYKSQIKMLNGDCGLDEKYVKMLRVGSVCPAALWFCLEIKNKGLNISDN